MPVCWPDTAPAFTVASVTVAPPTLRALGVSEYGGQVHYSNFGMKWLLETAYHLKEFQVEGPAWLNNHFEPKFVIEGDMPA